MTTLLLDADILAFKVASVSQKTYQFPDCEPHTVVDEWDEVEPRVVRMIEDLKERLKTDKVIVCLSCPTEENWRMRVLPTYKGNRDYSVRPFHLAAVKDFMAESYPSYRRDTLEADDIMGILSTHPTLVKGKKVIVSEDKDMQCIPGWLFNPAKDAKPRLITETAADRWHLFQTIVGDVTDGYTGCPGAGPDKAMQCLDQSTSWAAKVRTISRGPRKGTEVVEWEPWEDGFSTTWERVVSLFNRYGLTEDDALVQARVARICRASDYDFKSKEIRLWTPNT